MRYSILQGAPTDKELRPARSSDWQGAPTKELRLARSFDWQGAQTGKATFLEGVRNDMVTVVQGAETCKVYNVLQGATNGRLTVLYGTAYTTFSTGTTLKR